MIEANLDYRAAIATIGETLTGEATILEVLGEMTVRAFGGMPSEDVPATVPELPPPMVRPAPTPEPLPVVHPPIEEVFPVPELHEGIYLLSAEDEEPEPVPETPEAVAVFLAHQEPFAYRDLPENATISYAPLGLEFVTPVYGRVSSPFGFRMHPLRGEVRFHFGTDIAAYSGTPISAFADGRVVAARENDSWGKYILLYHGDGIYTRYAHASVKYVQAGDTVERGQRIGRVGMTGGATGPHLHFELRVEGMYRNPEFYLSFA